MSTLKVNSAQIGQSLTATNNFTWYQPSTPDGTVRLGVGNSGATTSDVVTVNSSGNVGIGTSSPAGSLCVTGSSQGLGNNLATSNPTGGVFSFVDPNSATIVNTVRLGQDNGSTSGVTDVQVISYGSADNQGGGNLRFVNSRYSLETGLIKSSRQSVNTGYLAFFTQPGSGLVERMRLDASGNLGLGVTPSASWQSTRRVLQVGGSAALWASSSGAGSLFLSNNTYFDGTNFRYLNTSGASYFAQATDGSFSFNQVPSGTAGNAISFTQAMTLDASGALSNVSYIKAGSYLWAAGDTSSGGIYLGSAGSNNARIGQNSAGTGTTTTYIGNATITTSSDIRLKKNIIDSQCQAVETLNKIRVVDHEWDDPTDTSINNRNSRGVWVGLIAQEAISHIPWLVNKPLEDEDEKGNPQYWHMDYGYAVPVLIKAIQELAAELNELKTKVNA